MNTEQLKDKVLSFLHRRETAALTATITKAVGAPMSTVERVLDELEDDGRVKSKRRGRSLLWTPAKTIQEEFVESNAEEMGLLEDPPITEDGTPLPIEEIDGDSLTEDSEERKVWVARRGGKRLGEVAELQLGNRVCYQIISPFDPKTFDCLSDAFRAFGG